VNAPNTAPIWISNGTYGALLTARGTGFSVYGEQLLTSWQDDPCEDDLGFTIFLRDPASGDLWTACGAPIAGQAIRGHALDAGGCGACSSGSAAIWSRISSSTCSPGRRSSGAA
jgi:cellobiose phosphorylase